MKSNFRNFEVQIHPTAAQWQQLDVILDSQRFLYNICLGRWIDNYQKYLTYQDKIKKENKSDLDLFKELTEIRQDPEFSKLPARLQRGTIDQFYKTTQSFCRRCKEQKKSKSTSKIGYPRFKSKNRFTSFNFEVFEGKLKFSSHRELPTDKPKKIVFKKKNNKWIAIICYAVEGKILPTNYNIAAGDLGISSLLTFTDGSKIDNLRFSKKSADKIRILNRSLARKDKKSKNRKKCVSQLAREHQRIANKRKTYLHQVSRKLVNSYGTLIFEKLNIKNMIEDQKFNHSIHDVAWHKC